MWHWPRCCSARLVPRQPSRPMIPVARPGMHRAEVRGRWRRFAEPGYPQGRSPRAVASVRGTWTPARPRPRVVASVRGTWTPQGRGRGWRRRFQEPGHPQGGSRGRRRFAAASVVDPLHEVNRRHLAIAVPAGRLPAGTSCFTRRRRPSRATPTSFHFSPESTLPDKGAARRAPSAQRAGLRPATRRGRPARP